MTRNSNYTISPHKRYIHGYIASNDQFCGSNGQCNRFECQEWVDDVSCYPDLVRDGRYGFAICPKCGASYGKDAITGAEYNSVAKCPT